MHFCLEHLFQFPLSPINVLRYPTPEMGVENAGEVVGGVMVRDGVWVLGYGGGNKGHLHITPQPSIMKIHS